MPHVGDDIKLLRLGSAIERLRPLHQGRLDETREAFALGGERMSRRIAARKDNHEKNPAGRSRLRPHNKFPRRTPPRVRPSLKWMLTKSESSASISHRGALCERDIAITIARQDSRITCRAQEQFGP